MCVSRTTRQILLQQEARVPAGSKYTEFRTEMRRKFQGHAMINKRLVQEANTSGLFTFDTI